MASFLNEDFLVYKVCFRSLENGTFNGSSEAERKTQSYYLSCLNTQRIEELGAQPLIDLITKVQPVAMATASLRQICSKCLRLETEVSLEGFCPAE